MILLLPLAAYYVSWVIVHSKIASKYVDRWQTYWETRWYDRRPDAAPSDEWQSKLAYLPSCIWCTGYWVSLGFVLAVLPFTEIPVWPLWPLILLYMSALIGIIDSLTHREA